MESLSILIIEPDHKIAKEVYEKIKKKNRTEVPIETVITSKLPEDYGDYEVFLISDKIEQDVCLKIKEGNPFASVFLLTQEKIDNELDYEITCIISSKDTDVRHILKIAEEIEETKKRTIRLAQRMTELDECSIKLAKAFAL